MKVVIKILALTVLLFGMNWFYSFTEYDRFLYNEADQLLQVDKIKWCDVIYTSASSNFSATDDPSEWDKRKISQMLSEYFPDLQFEAINKPASHAHTHLLLLKMFPKNAEIKTIVATINLRSFGASWINSNLETPLNKQCVMYHQRPPLFNRALIGFHGYNSKSDEEREQDMLKDWAKNQLPFPEPRNNVDSWCAAYKWGDWQDPRRQLADQFIKQYAFIVDESNPRVKDFDEIAELCKERGWNLLFHILPENIQWADSLAGPELSQLMRANAAFLQNRYEAVGIPVVNSLELLDPKYFTDKDFPTEHYYARGRWLVARDIAMKLETIHPKSFKTLE